jgi:hypothetical protein
MPIHLNRKHDDSEYFNSWNQRSISHVKVRSRRRTASQHFEMRRPRFGWQWVLRRLLHPVESLSAYSLLYHYPNPSTALKLKRLLCFCANFKSACWKCQLRKSRTPSLKQLSRNLSLLTTGSAAVWLSCRVDVPHFCQAPQDTRKPT